MRLAERSNTASFVGSEDRIKTRSFYMLEIWQFINIFLSALVTGVFWGSWLGLSRAIASFPPETFLAIGHTMIDNLAPGHADSHACCHAGDLAGSPSVVPETIKGTLSDAGRVGALRHSAAGYPDC